MIDSKNLFHVAFPVHDLAVARDFYGGVLECEETRSSDRWVDFNLFGHQIVAHLAPESPGIKAANPVDADNVPVPHLGEQSTMFFLDPSGNALEFKALADFSRIFC